MLKGRREDCQLKRRNVCLWKLKGRRDVCMEAEEREKIRHNELELKALEFKKDVEGT